MSPALTAYAPSSFSVQQVRVFFIYLTCPFVDLIYVLYSFLCAAFVCVESIWCFLFSKVFFKNFQNQRIKP